ncbi:hypothetical protein M0805_005182 [Coniferiporia weirii]|nr:hypothetical protein M0805_005182 [Coniferiporia weirii]
MVQWLGSIGIRPSAILAHSLGEIAAAVVTGVMNFSTALEFAIVWANAMRPEHTDGGLMAALRAPVEPINKRIAALGLSKTVSIAAYNSDMQDVVSGDAQLVRRLVDDLTAKAIKGAILPVNQGFHSRALKSDGHLSADYWVKQARQPIRFSDAACEFLMESKCQVVLDVGPQNVIAHLLKDAITQTSGDMAVSSVCDRPVTNSLSPLMQNMATLFVLGSTPNFEEFYVGQRVGLKKTAIPTYPWQKQRHYPTIIPSRTGSSRSPLDSDAYSKSWENGKELGPLLEKEHTLNGVPIVPAAALAMRDVLKSDISGNSFTCTHLQGDAEKGVICSRTLSNASAAPTVSNANNANRPDVVLDKKDIYRKFGDFLVQFGTSFQCIGKIEVSPQQATGLIEVPSSGNTQHDFTRKMDAILHMFGAIAPDGPPELKSSGAFLPSAINGFTLLTHTIPERFVCRYRFHIAVSPNSKKMTAILEKIVSTFEFQGCSTPSDPSNLLFKHSDGPIDDDADDDPARERRRGRRHAQAVSRRRRRASVDRCVRAARFCKGEQLANTFVNAFVNTGFGVDKLVAGDAGDISWRYKNKAHARPSRRSPSASSAAATAGPAVSGCETPTQCALLLANALADADALRRELNSAQKRSSRAECLLARIRGAFPGSPGTTTTIAGAGVEPTKERSERNGIGVSENAIKAILSAKARAERVERTSEDPVHLLHTVTVNFTELERYEAACGLRAADAHAAFARTVSSFALAHPPSGSPTLSESSSLRLAATGSRIS